MKWLAKCMIAAALLFAGRTAQAQTADAAITNPSTLAEARPAADVQPKELTLTLKNDCTRDVSVYTGSKKEVFGGKSQSLGGLSNNTIYVMEGDVVCIMNNPKTIQACAIAKPGMSKVEINQSGNGFVK